MIKWWINAAISAVFYYDWHYVVTYHWRSQNGIIFTHMENLLTLVCWTRIYPAFANSVDPDQLASEEANWSGSALFAIKYVNL